jgi:hypothetical protein
LVALLAGTVLVHSASCSSGGAAANGPGGAGPDAAADGAPTTSTSGDKGPLTGASANGVLRIESIDIVGDHVTDGASTGGTGQKVRLVALVSDKKGSDFISGGDVRGSDGKLAVPFDAKGNGHYEAEIGWDDVARVQAISFVAPGGDAKLTAKFVDGDGNAATVEVPIPLQCTGPNYSACAGMCTAPVDNDQNNCGQCGKQCKVESCINRQCIGLLDSYTQTPQTCTAVCAKRDGVCASTCDFDDNGVVKKVLGLVSFSGTPDQYLTDCNTVPTGAGTMVKQYCCCADP